MDDSPKFRLFRTGTLKYNRIKSMSILKKELNSFGYDYSIKDTKELFITLTEGNLYEGFNGKFKHCFDLIFNDNEYDTIKVDDFEEHNFPVNFISPFAN
jgi:hypothetical protein